MADKFRGWLSPIPGEHPLTCVRIWIPDDLEHKQAFYGALSMLTRAYNWDTGGDQDWATWLASYWSNLLFDVGNTPCEGVGTVEFRLTEGCGLEYRIEGGDWSPVDGWETYASQCFIGPPGEPGPVGPPGDSGEYDSEGGVPTPAGEASEDKQCKIATAIAEGMLARYLAWLDAWIDLLAENAYDYYDAYNALQNHMLDVAQGGGAASASVGPTASALIRWGALGLFDVLGIGAVISGFLAYFTGKELLDYLAIETAISSPEFKEELICLILASLGTDGNLTATAWSEIRGAIPAMTEATADARGDFKDYQDKAVPVAIARTFALKTPAAWDCEHCNEPEPCDDMHGWDWCFSVDWTEAAKGWVSNLGGAHVVGRGWTCTGQAQAYERWVRGGMQYPVTYGITSRVRRVEVTYDHPVDGQGSNYLNFYVGSSAVGGFGLGVGNNLVAVWTGLAETQGVAYMRFRFQTGYRGGIPAAWPNPFGRLDIRKVTVWGTGPAPGQWETT